MQHIRKVPIFFKSSEHLIRVRI
jgi:hypothetical protein